MTNSAEKYTARKFYTDVIAAAISDEVTAFAEAELVKMDARNEKRKEKLAAKNAELQPVIDQVVNEILSDEPMSATDIGKILGFSAQKTSPLMAKIVAAGNAKIVELKRKGAKPVNGYVKA